jgi:hypothetical protein
MMSVAKDWMRYPEPHLQYLEHCWARGRPWHWFIEPEHLADPVLASAIYARFLHEGPTSDTLVMMRYLDISELSDQYAVGIMDSLVQQALACEPVPRTILYLWRRYEHPRQGLPAAIILDSDYTWPAMRIVEFLTDDARLALVPAMVEVESAAPCACARQHIRDLSVLYPRAAVMGSVPTDLLGDTAVREQRWVRRRTIVMAKYAGAHFRVWRLIAMYL